VRAHSTASKMGDSDAGAQLAAFVAFFAIFPILFKNYFGYHLFPPRVHTIGVDLGTTHSLVAYMDPTNFSVKVLKSVPSIVTFLPNGTRVVGNPGLLKERPRQTIFEAKQFLGLTYDQYMSDDALKRFPFRVTSLNSGRDVGFIVPSSAHKVNMYTPLDVGKEVVLELYRRLVDHLGYSSTVNQVVIATPAEFTTEQKALTAKIFENAGLKVIRVLDEPTAAAIAYGLENDATMNNVIVYDWGGGTLDIALLWVQNSNLQLLATDGNRFFGGADLDICFAESLAAHFRGTDEEKTNCPFYELRRAAEIAKEELSLEEATSVACGGVVRRVSRDDFENACESVLKRAMEPLSRLLKDSHMDPADVDAVVLVGGSTRVPYVRRKIKEMFNGKPALTNIDPDTAVAVGAARASDD
jgi:molecular chaperone DnaK (HSP70)